jgi:hypothetical protein
MEGEVITEKGL